MMFSLVWQKGYGTLLEAASNPPIVCRLAGLDGGRHIPAKRIYSKHTILTVSTEIETTIYCFSTVAKFQLSPFPVKWPKIHKNKDAMEG